MTPDEFGTALAAAKAGDESGFTLLFRYAQPACLRYLRVISPDRYEDIAGDTWVQVVRGLHAFEAVEAPAFRGWVLSIARHRWLDDQRARGRRLELVVDEVPERPSGTDAAGAVEEMMSTEAALTLIARLPKDQAEVIALRYIADLDVAGTAEVLGKEPGAVRVLAHRGLKRLQQLVNKRERSEQV